MSIAAARVEVANVLTTVLNGTSVLPYRTKFVGPRKGWLIIREVSRGGTFREVTVTFDVVIPLTSDLVGSESAIEAIAAPLFVACQGLGGDVSVRPVEVSLDQATLFGVVATFTTESEIN